MPAMKKNRLTDEEKEKSQQFTAQLEDLLKSLGWSQKILSKKIAPNRNDKNAIKKEYERIKKDIQRGRKGENHPHTIQRYIRAILKHEDYTKLVHDIVYHPSDFSDPEDKRLIEEIIKVCEDFSKKHSLNPLK